MTRPSTWLTALPSRSTSTSKLTGTSGATGPSLSTASDRDFRPAVNHTSAITDFATARSRDRLGIFSTQSDRDRQISRPAIQQDGQGCEKGRNSRQRHGLISVTSLTGWPVKGGYNGRALFGVMHKVFITGSPNILVRCPWERLSAL